MQFKTIFFAVTLLATGSVFASVTEEETYTFTLDEGGRFSLSNVNGSVTVTGVAGNEVGIVATKKADDQDDLENIEIKVSHSAAEIVVETEIGKSNGWFSWGNNSGSVKYEVTVPMGTVLNSIDTVNGDIMISGVTAEVVAESVNGEIDIEGLEGDASLSTVNGSIDARFNKLEGRQKVKAETVNGRVAITLPGNADAEINADTLNGSIDARDFGLETDKGFVGSDLNGKIGGGSARLNVDTVNGSIKIRSN